MGFSCVLCFKNIVKHNERYLFQGKGTFNALEELKRLPIRVNLCYGGYMCKQCLYNLKKCAGLIRQLLEIESAFENAYNLKKEAFNPPQRD
jgi:hypothetical protein